VIADWFGSCLSPSLLTHDFFISHYFFLFADNLRCRFSPFQLCHRRFLQFFFMVMPISFACTASAANTTFLSPSPPLEFMLYSRQYSNNNTGFLHEVFIFAPAERFLPSLGAVCLLYLHDTDSTPRLRFWITLAPVNRIFVSRLFCKSTSHHPLDPSSFTTYRELHVLLTFIILELTPPFIHNCTTAHSFKHPRHNAASPVSLE
jgi:hypothetical protein